MGLFNSAKSDAKKQEKRQNIAKWNEHIRKCASKNRIAQIQHLNDYLDFPSIAFANTIVMAKVFCEEYEMNGETKKSIRINLLDTTGDLPKMSLPVDGYEAARVLFKIVPFFLLADSDWLRRFEWNHGSSYDCDDSYSGKTYFFPDGEEDYDTSIKSENDVFVQKQEIPYLSDRALLYLADIIEFWRDNNLSEFVGSYDLWGKKRDFVLSYELPVNQEIEKRGLTRYEYEEDNDDEFINYGEQGEENVEYALKWLPKKYKTVFKGFDGIVLRDFKVSDETQEIDHIAVGPNGVFVIETKYYKGNITIDSWGNWSREVDGEIESLKNPIQQVDRHHMIVTSILDGIVAEEDIHDIICLSYDSCTVSGVDNSPIPVVKVDVLGRCITDCNSKQTYSQSDIERIIDKIEEYRA